MNKLTYLFLAIMLVACSKVEPEQKTTTSLVSWDSYEYDATTHNYYLNGTFKEGEIEIGDLVLPIIGIYINNATIIDNKVRILTSNDGGYVTGTIYAKENIIMIVLVKVIALVLGVFDLLPVWGAVFSDTGICLLAILNALRVFKYAKFPKN